jgi:V/A-type H+-transporting ATPase subunit I
MERLQDLAQGRYAFALQGWVPSEEACKVRDGLQKQFGDDLVIEHRPANEHHDAGVPVKLDNPDWMRPFQGLLSLFAPPRYGGFDPTWTLATFFPLFFGIVVGDIAYGLLFLAFALWLGARGRKRRNLDLGPLGIVIPARNLPGIATVISWCAGWTIVWGVIYGEFWGNFLEHWPEGRPVFGAHGEGIFDILLFRVEVFTPLLILTLGFGTLQVLMGWAIRAYYGYKHHDAKHTWEGVGMFAGLAGVVIFATAYLTDALGPAVLSVAGLLLAVFLVGVVASGLPLMLVELISNSGHILSYLRLFAVGLSAALVANLGTDAGFATNAAIGVPVLGELLGAVVAIVINLAAVILTLVGHTLQPLRLQYVEFFTKFGFYEQSGRPYTPFRLFGGKA